MRGIRAAGRRHALLSPGGGATAAAVAAAAAAGRAPRARQLCQARRSSRTLFSAPRFHLSTFTALLASSIQPAAPSLSFYLSLSLFLSVLSVSLPRTHAHVCLSLSLSLSRAYNTIACNRPCVAAARVPRIPAAAEGHESCVTRVAPRERK